MAITITLQRNGSENNKLSKALTTLAEMSATLKAETSIIDPVFLVAADLATVAGCNYITVPAFNRSYFVLDIVSIRAGLVQISAHVDVLSSFKTQIRANTGIIKRAERSDTYNLYLNDGSLRAYQDPYIITKAFPSGFTGTCFILSVAGGS